ncbi:MAG: polysaccharide biosynthesis tyrosine autokinase [Chitinophagaceae bacterium]
MSLDSNSQINGNSFFSQKQILSQFSLSELLFKYLSFLPLILLFFTISVGVGYVYVRYKEPVYKASIQMLVKFEDAKQNLSDGNDLIQRALRETKQLNIDNEITKLKSLDLLTRVAKDGGLNVKIRNLGRFRSSTLYHESPISLEILKVLDSTSSFELRFRKFDSRSAHLEEGFSISENIKSIDFNKIYSNKGVVFRIIKKQDFSEFNEPISFLYEPPIQTARKISGALTVASIGKTSIIQIELKDDNPIRAKEILDKLVEIFQVQDVEAKKTASINTINFINERMKDVSEEIDTLESKILELKMKTPFNEVGPAYEFVKNRIISTDEASQKIILQNEIVGMLEEYLKKDQNENRSVPTDLGIENVYLFQALREYNNLQLAYERDKQQYINSESNKYLADYRLKLKELRYNIFEILKNIRLENNKRIGVFEDKLNTLTSSLSKLPETERQLKNVQTQGNIKRELYLYLLKRKEEIGITSATFVSNYSVIDAAFASLVPVEPRTENIRNFSMLIGLIIPILLIYLIDIFNDKVTLRDQIVKKVNMPIAGEVTHVADPSKFVFNQSRSLVSEQFRILRTNLTFLFKGAAQSKVILITSTISGEGKSFVSSNLAAALSLTEKKVALLLFDLRKLNTSAAIDKILGNQKNKGITNYLIGQADDFYSLKVLDMEYENLHIYPAGPIPPNPAELLLSSNMKGLFDKLRNEYDYIVVDSAPVGLVSDAFILQEYADITLYIVRQQYTLLKQLDFISEINETQKLRSLSIVVNDVKMAGRYGYYGYNYSYGYSYAYKYGYGYKGSKSAGNYYGDSYLSDGIALPWWAKIMRLFSRKK